MNNLRNKVHLIGRLGKDVEIFKFEDGTPKASFSLATNEHYKDKNGVAKDKTEWHNLVAYGKTAELAGELLKKGVEVAIDGKLTTRKYTDKEGNTKYISEVQINEFLLLERTEKVEA